MALSTYGHQGMEEVSQIPVTVTVIPTVSSLSPSHQPQRKAPNPGTWKSAPQQWLLHIAVEKTTGKRKS